MLLKNKLFGLLLLVLIFISGCANHVTDKTITDIDGKVITPVLREFEFTFTFREPPAQQNNYNYYLIISSRNFQVIYPDFQPEAYFFAPGELYDNLRMVSSYYGGDTNKDLQNVYTDYFSSWDRYLRYDNTDRFSHYTGPFVASANHNSYQPVMLNFGNLGGARELKLQLNLNLNNFYFNLLAVDQNFRLQDKLNNNIYFSYTNGKILEESSLPNLTIDGGLDIVNFKVRSYEY